MVGIGVVLNGREQSPKPVEDAHHDEVEADPELIDLLNAVRNSRPKKYCAYVTRFRIGPVLTLCEGIALSQPRRMSFEVRELYHML